MKSKSARIARRRAKRMAALSTVDVSLSRRAEGHLRNVGGMLTKLAIDRVIESYAQYVAWHVAKGYEAYLLTFMFHHIRGSKATVTQAMTAAIEASYSATVTLVHRYPQAARAQQKDLIWIGYPDYPVAKQAKSSLADVSINDGRHYHVIALVPPYSRLKRGYDCTIEHFHDRFAPAPISRLHCRHIKQTPEVVVDYALKQLQRRRCTLDELFCLPRSLRELPGDDDFRRTEAWRLAGPPVPRDPMARHHRSGGSVAVTPSRATMVPSPVKTEP